MSRRPCRFTQADIHRAIKAVKQSGERMAVVIDLDGTIRITYPESVGQEPQEGPAFDPARRIML